MNFKWISYSLAIAAWNTIFTGMLVGTLNIVYSIIKHPMLTTSDLVLTFIVGYIVLFTLNIRIIDDEL